MSAVEYAVAFGGGVVSFLSPCVLPVVPAYLSVTTGLSSEELEAPSGRSLRVAFRGGVLFVAGFSLVFVVLGLSVTAAGSLLLRNQVPITRISGVAVMGLALMMLAATLPLRWAAGRELRFHPQVSRYGVWGAPVAGAAFAFGWTPCIGPVLASVLTVAADQRGLGQGALLLASYAAGLAVPFLLAALAFHRSLVAFRAVRRHSALLMRVSAGVLGAYGLLLAFDQLNWITLRLQRGAVALGLARLVGLG
jgi:cytochrome c-type biogenesis protein